MAAQGSGPEAMCGRTVSARLAGVLSWAGGPQARDPLTTPPVLLLQGPRPSCSGKAEALSAEHAKEAGQDQVQRSQER